MKHSVISSQPPAPPNVVHRPEASLKFDHLKMQILQQTSILGNIMSSEVTIPGFWGKMAILDLLEQLESLAEKCETQYIFQKFLCMADRHDCSHLVFLPFLAKASNCSSSSRNIAIFWYKNYLL